MERGEEGAARWGLPPVSVPRRIPCPWQETPFAAPAHHSPCCRGADRTPGRWALPAPRCQEQLPASPRDTPTLKPEEKRVFDEVVKVMPAAGPAVFLSHHIPCPSPHAPAPLSTVWGETLTAFPWTVLGVGVGVGVCLCAKIRRDAPNTRPSRVCRVCSRVL